MYEDEVGTHLNPKIGRYWMVPGQQKEVLTPGQNQKRYIAGAKVIHVILANYSVHRTQQVALSLASEAGQRLRRHFLPPYCPDHNKIERTWQDLHANVTRNHRCRTIDDLLRNVGRYL